MIKTDIKRVFQLLPLDLPMQIQMPSLAQVRPGSLSMRYMLKNIAAAGSHGTPGAMKASFFLKINGSYLQLSVIHCGYVTFF